MFRSRRFRWAVGVALGLFIGINVVAYRHAYRLTHFVETGERTKSPEKLSAWQRVGVLVSGVSIPKPTTGPIPAGYQAVRIDGRLEAWEAAGNGEVVAMFPGHGVSKSMLLEEAKVLREFGCRTVLVDFRGCGGSDGTVCTLGWHEAEDVTAVMDWTRRKHAEARLILYGQSMGAAAVLRAVATAGVQPDGVIVECPFDRLGTTVEHRFHAMGLPAFPFAHFLLFWGGVQHGFNPFDHNPVDYAWHVTVPGLVIGGVDDPWVKPVELRRVAAAMRGPTMVRVLPAGHGAYVWSAPNEYRQAVADWLQKFRLKS